ncbi:hypothetical protein L226DRAFT_562053 [Lentinus tigrinus ALCF2SS1-7]|uniref:uncharacterized protein n=1 Tax=Lentinus tigrinus ALCF2SS1-7 TaxID=1328758 RepID=UPI001165D721|nr:hypothetical protein L226DRAFT_562053 [Lentinus tigrinus ALCF2SS1-7]
MMMFDNNQDDHLKSSYDKQLTHFILLLWMGARTCEQAGGCTDKKAGGWMRKRRAEPSIREGAQPCWSRRRPAVIVVDVDGGPVCMGKHGQVWMEAWASGCVSERMHGAGASVRDKQVCAGMRGQAWAGVRASGGAVACGRADKRVNERVGKQAQEWALGVDGQELGVDGGELGVNGRGLEEMVNCDPTCSCSRPARPLALAHAHPNPLFSRARLALSRLALICPLALALACSSTDSFVYPLARSFCP